MQPILDEVCSPQVMTVTVHNMFSIIWLMEFIFDVPFYVVFISENTASRFVLLLSFTFI